MHGCVQSATHHCPVSAHEAVGLSVFHPLLVNDCNSHRQNIHTVTRQAILPAFRQLETVKRRRSSRREDGKNNPEWSGSKSREIRFEIIQQRGKVELQPPHRSLGWEAGALHPSSPCPCDPACLQLRGAASGPPSTACLPPPLPPTSPPPSHTRRVASGPYRRASR